MSFDSIFFLRTTLKRKHIRLLARFSIGAPPTGESQTNTIFCCCDFSYLNFWERCFRGRVNTARFVIAMTNWDLTNHVRNQWPNRITVCFDFIGTYISLTTHIRKSCRCMIFHVVRLLLIEHISAKIVYYFNNRSVFEFWFLITTFNAFLFCLHQTINFHLHSQM